MSDSLNDLRFGARMLRKRPGTTALAIVALALGIGLTSTMFSIIQGVFLRGLPFEEPDRLVALVRRQLSDQGQRPVPMDDFLDWRESQRSFESLGALQTRTASIAGDFAAERARLVLITPNMLRLLRVAPVAGRDFNEADAQPGAPRVAIISHLLWTSSYQQQPAVIGRVIRVNGVPTTIVGVAPERFGFPVAHDLWMPLEITRPATRGEGPAVDVVGRLAASATLASARAEMQAIARRLADQHGKNRDVAADVMPYLTRFLGADVPTTLSVMLGAVLGVMLIACANVTTLQLARAAERTREVAVRTALGAGRARIVRQLLVEGLLLATLGAVAGLLLARAGLWWFNSAISTTNPPFWIDIRIDGTVLAFATLLAVCAAVIASLVPALRATRLDTNAVLKDEGRGNTGLRLGRVIRNLVVAEVLVSCCLLVVSGLMWQSVMASGVSSYPYATEQVFAASFNVDDARYATPADRARVAERLEAAFATLPGVRHVSVGTGAPHNGCCGRRVAVEGQTYARPDDRPQVRYRAVSPAHFDALAIRAVAGRLFTAADGPGALPVVVISADLSEQLFAGTDPIGRRVMVGDDATAPWRTVIGVVPRLVRPATNDNVTGMTFAPLAQTSDAPFMVLASVTGDPAALGAAARAKIAEVDPDMALYNINSLAGVYWTQTWAIRVFGSLFMAFGLAALLLATAGLYGVMAFSVRQRTQEIGVRMALGASRARVVGMVFWQGLWRVSLGIALGLAPGWWLGGLLGSLAFSLPAANALIYVAAIGALGVSGGIAAIVPALRAASVDPLVALRQE